MILRSEHRRSNRRPLEGRIVVTWEDNGEPFEVRGSCRDISETGVGVYIDHPVPKGAYVAVRNRLSSLRRAGVVRHTTSVGTGYRLGVEAGKPIGFRYD